jgi:hypothetical protein
VAVLLPARVEIIMTPRVCILLVCLFIAACGGNSTTAPSETGTTTTTVATPTTTEVWTSTVQPGGFKFYSFTVSVNGTVNLTLTDVEGQFVPSTLQLDLGIGSPSGTDCTTTQTINTGSGVSAQVTLTEAPGVYCARVSDIGNLFAPATFTVNIDHP